MKPLIVFAGGDPTGQGTEALGDCWGWDLTLNQWLIGAEKTTHVSNISDLVGLVYNDSLYMASVGGYDGLAIQTVNEWLNLGYVLIDGVKSIGAGKSNFTLYPNPANDHFSLSFEGLHQDLKISVMDITGRVVIRQVAGSQQNAVRISTTDLTAGAYTVQVVGADGELLGNSQFILQ